MQLTFENIEGSGEIYLDVMRAICGDTSDKTMADLMCFHSPHNSQLGFKESTYVDVQDRPLDNAGQQHLFVNMDVIDFLKKGNHFDVTMCSDGLEHLTTYKGRTLVNLMERNSDKQIIFTPLGEYMMTKDKHPDSHRSGWYPEYFQDWATIVFPHFHPTLNIGAFFAYHCEDIKQDFKMVSNELKNKLWIK